MKTISILGCGWLGIPLAETLIQKGFSIKGSTTSANKLSVLQNKGIEPFAISLEADGVEGDIQKFFRLRSADHRHSAAVSFLAKDKSAHSIYRKFGFEERIAHQFDCRL
jgi:nucleoside-diphosphate-sugar epimerase